MEDKTKVNFTISEIFYATVEFDSDNNIIVIPDRCFDHMQLKTIHKFNLNGDYIGTINHEDWYKSMKKRYTVTIVNDSNIEISPDNHNGKNNKNVRVQLSNHEAYKLLTGLNDQQLGFIKRLYDLRFKKYERNKFYSANIQIFESLPDFVKHCLKKNYQLKTLAQKIAETIYDNKGKVVAAAVIVACAYLNRDWLKDKFKNLFAAVSK